MYQFNGWIDLVDDPEDPEDAMIDAAAAGVSALIQSFDWGNATGEVRTHNGSTVLSLFGASNRPGRYPANILAVLEHIVEQAPGSFGLIHWRDDEHPDLAAREIYHVIALRRGTITETSEPLFSPITPKIEP